ncbi:MAG: zinc-dependent metalloprotease [Planctomycetota bacterium]|jgi:hypothetical protein
MQRLSCLLVAVLAVATAVAADDKKPEIPKKPVPVRKPDFPPWSEVGKDLQIREGFWHFHEDKKKTKFWIEITQIDKPFLMATSISGGTTMRGWQWNDWLLLWQVHDKKLVLIERNVGFKASKGQKELKEAIGQTYTDRVVGSYRIVAKGPKGGYVIDGRGFFASGAPTFFGSLGRSKDASLAKFDGSKNFPKNSEVRVTLPRAGRGTLITLHYSLSGLENTGYKPRQADDRVGYFTTNLTDFSVENKDENRTVRFINRWHLVKADPKLELSEPKKRIEFYIEKTVPVRFRRYVREGILEWNEAFEKIGFDQAIVVHQQTDTRYADLDPEDIRYNFFRWIFSDMPFAMGPSRVDPRTGQILDADILMDDSYIRFTLQEYRLTIREVPAALVGRQDRELFERHPLRRLGLVPAREEFPEVPADAARPNVGPHARRAFCSIGRGARHQLGCCSLFFKANDGGKPEANDGGKPKADKKEEFPEELIGQFIKDTVMHEVGHTLGLRHNFKASILRTIDEINSDSKPATIAGSVMDYHPIAIAPEGRPQGNWAMRTIGPYDYWAIEYGYASKEPELKKILSRVAEKGLDYATDEDLLSHDPFVNTWDLGADPLAYARERIALMKRLRKNLEARAVDEGERYHRLRRAMDMQFYEARNAGYLAVQFVGGEHIHRDHRGDPNARAPLVPVDVAKQREALGFVCEEILSGRYFDFPPELMRKLAPDFYADDFFSFFFDTHDYPYLDNVLRVQLQLVLGLTSPSRLGRVLDARHKTPAEQEVLTGPEVFDTLQATIFGDLAGLPGKSTNQKPALGATRRNLQREYVGQLIYILLRGERRYPAPIQTLARHYVRNLASDIANARAGARELDTYTRAHLEECQTRLERALEASYNFSR